MMIRAAKQFGTASLLCAGLGGCVVAQPPPVPLVAVPGPNKTQLAFQQDDAACRAALTSPAAAPVPNGAQPGPSPLPGGAYLNCMSAHGNAVTPLAPPPPTYLYAAGYPAYGDYDPWLWDDPGVVGLGFYGGCCWGGWGGGWRGGGWHGGGWGGGGWGGGGGWHGGGGRR